LFYEFLDHEAQPRNLQKADTRLAGCCPGQWSKSAADTYTAADTSTAADTYTAADTCTASSKTGACLE